MKFNDADLIGMPLRVTIGKRGLKQGAVELKRRDGDDVELLPLETAADSIRERVKSARTS